MAILHFSFRQRKVADKTIAHEQLKKHAHRMTFAHCRTGTRVRNKYKYFPRNANNKVFLRNVLGENGHLSIAPLDFLLVLQLVVVGEAADDGEVHGKGTGSHLSRSRW